MTCFLASAYFIPLDCGTSSRTSCNTGFSDETSGYMNLILSYVSMIFIIFF